MKKIAISFLAFALLFNCNAFSFGKKVFTIFNDCIAPCYKPCCPLLGIYVDVNVGYSWLSLAPYRGNVFGLFPLGIDHVKEKAESFITAIGYDFYPCAKVPLRLEVSYFYADEDFRINPLFAEPENNLFSDDRFLARNTLGTLYFDWHTCTRFVPYVGLSAGLSHLKTYHHPNDIGDNQLLAFKDKQDNFSWGATLGTRYFFANYFFANLQLRFSDMGKTFFKDFTPEAFSPLPQSTHFQSDFLHETTVLFGLGYIF